MLSLTILKYRSSLMDIGGIQRLIPISDHWYSETQYFFKAGVSGPADGQLAAIL